MSCKNPKICMKKHERWKRNQKHFIELGEREHELFLKYLQNGEASLNVINHADQRQYERVINIHDVQDIILHGWVIERNFFPDIQVTRLVILGYTRKYRPIHVVTEAINKKTWEIITVYNPESKKLKWSGDYQERVCFCK